MPYIDSPFKKPEIWQQQVDCLFMDSDEATQEQLNFIARVKRFYDNGITRQDATADPASNLYEFRINEAVVPYETELVVPKKFQHVDLEKVSKAAGDVEEFVRRNRGT